MFPSWPVRGGMGRLQDRYRFVATKLRTEHVFVNSGGKERAGIAPLLMGNVTGRARGDVIFLAAGTAVGPATF